MDIKMLYNSIRNNDKGLVSIDSLDVNCKDDNGYTLLHFAAESNDVEFSKELMKRGVTYNSKTKDGKTPFDFASDSQMKNLFNVIRMFFKAVKKSNCDKIQTYIAQEPALVNVKEEYAGNALLWAINNGHKDIAKLLLDNAADVLQVTEEGNTSLHMAVTKGEADIVLFLLQNVPAYQLSRFTNVQNFEAKSACLHIAAENGYFRIVMLLLQHGAIYNIRNAVGETPYELSKCLSVKELLKVTNDSFAYANDCDDQLFAELNKLGYTKLEAVTNATDVNGNTIQDVAVSISTDFSNKLHEFLKHHKDQNVGEDGWRLEQLKSLKYRAELHEDFSETYIPMLRSCSNLSSYENNYHPWKTLKEGSYFLGNIYPFVKLYKIYRPTLIDDENVQVISDTLDKLQFHPSHISAGYTEEAYGGQVQCFVSKAQGHEFYYKLLHSKLKKDVRFFIDMVENEIDKPLKNFLLSIEEKLLKFPSYGLEEAVKEDNVLQANKYLSEGADINSVCDSEETPLSNAVKCNALKVLKVLLEKGANVQHIYQNGNTILHKAVSSSSARAEDILLRKEIIKCLLKYGAAYNCKNLSGEVPFDVAKGQLSKGFLDRIEKLFRKAENDDATLIDTLKIADGDEFDVMTCTRNSNGRTLLQLAFAAGHNVEKELLKMVKNKQTCAECNEKVLVQRKFNRIRELAEKQVRIRDIHLSSLRELSMPGDSEINQSPSKTLMEGTSYLCSAYNLVHEYNAYFAPFLPDADIGIIESALNQLQFYPEHVPGADEGELALASVVMGTEVYYKLLHSDNKKTVRDFVEFAELSIHNPAKRFFETGLNKLLYYDRCTIL